MDTRTGHAGGCFRRTRLLLGGTDGRTAGRDRSAAKGPFFEDLTTEDLQRLATIGERRTYAEGDEIVSRGEAGGGLFVILSGTARVETGGKEHILEPGAFLGEMSVLGARPRSATVTAAEPVETMTLAAIHFRPFLIKNPSVAVTILQGVVEASARHKTALIGRDQAPDPNLGLSPISGLHSGWRSANRPWRPALAERCPSP